MAISVLFLGIISFILPMRFILKPPRWDIEFRLIANINMLAAIVYFLLIYIHDTNYMIVSAIAPSLVIISISQDSDPLEQPFVNIIGCSLVTTIYAVICWLYVSRVTSKWKVATVVLFFSVIIGIILTYILIWYSHWKLLSYVLCGIDTFLLLMYVLYKRTLELLQEDQHAFLNMAELPTRFMFNDLQNATRNFQIKIGEGGSGAIFKGTLTDGSVIAVKRIKSQQSGQNEFKTEITIIASLQHISLVHLLGYCLTQNGERYLVYPFFENGSLDAWLFADVHKRSHLTWALRYQIAVDVSKALAYLHHDCRHRILHLDVKPANILLDGSFQARLSDFGISRSMERDKTNVMTRARGTVGYLPPEMLVPKAISAKSDVYSYGMVLFELLGGRRNFQSTVEGETRQRRNTYFPKIARDKIKEGNLMEVVDRCLVNTGHVTESEVELLGNVAFWCIQENPELRPNMNDVVDMLEGRKMVDVPPDSPMFVVNFLDIESEYIASKSDKKDTVRSSSNRENTPLSANTISISIELGR
ncbi:Receptor protein kinase [Rhynchospora pubera]|uniref:Receptor protein kinase n=1 Tax=Rhynchospora pubera TaxID=906938 RepID=A0AAV8GS78_9POAL|nr:Receptor protein kinase [Rhynchospora pubera]KAJ4806445.1 Receptor protein kinase [Rhynchospora pubera]